MTQTMAIDYWTNIFTPDGLRKMYTENEELAPVVKWWDMDDRIKGYEPADFVELLNTCNIEKVYVPSFKMQSYALRKLILSISEEDVRALMAACPGRVGGIYGIDITRGMAAVRELEIAIREWGFEGAHIHCNGWGIPLNHRDLYPVYAKCTELDVPVIVQCGYSAEKCLLKSVVRSGWTTLPFISPICVSSPRIRAGRGQKNLSRSHGSTRTYISAVAHTRPNTGIPPSSSF